MFGNKKETKEKDAELVRYDNTTYEKYVFSVQPLYRKSYSTYDIISQYEYFRFGDECFLCVNWGDTVKRVYRITASTPKESLNQIKNYLIESVGKDKADQVISDFMYQGFLTKTYFY